MTEMNDKTLKKKWGGKRAGSGRKPGPYAGSSKVTTVVLTAPLIEKLHKLGGSSWVREQIIKSDGLNPEVIKPESIATLTSGPKFFNGSADSVLKEGLVTDPENTVFCMASDDELKDKGIESGDLLIVDRKTEPKKGDWVVVHNADGYSIRNFVPDGEIPENQPNLFISPNSGWRILGIIAYIVKQLPAATGITQGDSVPAV